MLSIKRDIGELYLHIINWKQYKQKLLYSASRTRRAPYQTVIDVEN
jgi:hypothetical protein